MLRGRLLVAAALVASVFALRHDGEGVETFLLGTAFAGLGLVVLGRLRHQQPSSSTPRRRAVVAHRTVLYRWWLGSPRMAIELLRALPAVRPVGRRLRGRRRPL